MVRDPRRSATVVAQLSSSSDLIRDGYCVIKNVLSEERAAEIVSDIHEWLESYNLGYRRDDPSTIREECLPIIHTKGLIQAYGAPHEVNRRLEFRHKH